MRIYWWSNAPFANTGYGNQTAIFPRRLMELGHGMTMGSFYGLEGSPRKTSDMWLFPSGRDIYGNDVLARDAEYLESDIVITLMDIWVLRQPVTEQFRWVPWLPVDHDPAPPIVVDALRTCYAPIAYSKFGVVKLREAGFQAMYVPHGVETEVFKPMPKAEARGRFPACDPDVFLVGMVAANKGRPSRKAFDQQIRAFAELHRKHKDTMLYIHTDFAGVNNGEDIARIVELAGIDDKAIAKPDQYKYARGMIGSEQMVALYNSFDVFMNCARGEGFGIPILEAQACGTPAIVTDFSSMPELCFSGWKVGYSDKEFTYQGSYQVIPDVGDIADALEEAYLASGEKRATMREQARAGAMAYDADVVTREYWKPALEAIAERVEAEKTTASGHKHEWAHTGLFIHGSLVRPCLNGQCEAALIDNRMVQDGVFKPSVGDVPMDIEDDARGGVSKIIMRECLDTYHLDEVELSEGETALDIGAHVGVPSIYLAKRFPKARILSVEPSVENFERLTRNAEKNGAQIEAINAAVTGDGRRVSFPANVNGNSGGLSLYDAPKKGGRIVDSFTLAGLYERLGGAPALLKIDCEGAEYEILEGHTDELKGVKWMVGEFHTNNVFSEARADALIAACEAVVPNVHIGKSRMADSDPEIAKR